MDRGTADGILGQAVAGDADPGQRPGRRTAGHRLDSAGLLLGLGLALLGACTAGRSPPGPLALGGALLEPLAAPARATPLVVDLGSVPTPTPPGVEDSLAPPPATQPALAVQLPPPGKPPPRRSGPHVAWLPKLKPTIVRRSGATIEDRPLEPVDGAPTLRDPRVLWPPPPKPPLGFAPTAVAPAAGPPAGAPAEAPAETPAEAPAERAARQPDARPITVDHGAASRPEAAAAIGVAERDRRLQRLDEAAREALLAGDAAGALQLYERLASEAPAARAARLGQAIALQRLGRSAEARAVYQSLLQADPDDLDAKIALLGMVAARAPDEALGLLRRLARDHPDDHRLPAQIALVLAAQGDLAGAIAAARRAVALAPANLGDRTNLAILLDRAGQSRAAAEQYQNALELATLGGAPTTQLDAIAARLHHLRQPNRRSPRARRADPPRRDDRGLLNDIFIDNRLTERARS